jgi:hypothetical protein
MPKQKQQIMASENTLRNSEQNGELLLKEL